MNTKPHPTFQTIRADEVAECWNGVPRDLYATLWNEIVPLQKPIPNLEDSGPHDHVGHANLAAHWDRLAPEDQLLLNALAEQQDAEMRAAMEQARSPRPLHPYCNVCGWRKGGADSWNGRACKCGHSEPPITTNRKETR